MKVNMTPNPLDVVTIHASQGDTEARQWEFELHNNGELIDTSEITEQLFFKAYKGGTEQLLPENGSTPTTSPFKGDIRYPQGLLTNQEFTYRQSPTEEDGNAKIKNLYGNTLVWNQLVQNGNFADGTNNWEAGGYSTISASNGELTVTVGGAWNNDARQNRPLVVGHKYLGTFKVKSDTLRNIGVSLGQFGAVTNARFASTETLSSAYQTVVGIATITESTSVIRCSLTANASSYTGQTFTIKDVMLFDLTQMGLDITDPSEFTSLFSLPYYAYNQGTLLSFNGNGIKTVGKNLFDGVLQNGTLGQNGQEQPQANRYRSGFIRVLPNTTYCSSIDGTLKVLNFLFYDGNQNFISAIGSKVVTTPSNCAYVRFFYDQTILNVNLQFEFGSVATDYEPYTSSTLSLPISTYFPNGMKSAGNVYDEWTPSKATPRVGQLILDGTQTPRLTGIALNQVFSFDNLLTSAPCKTVNTNITSIYEIGASYSSVAYDSPKVAFSTVTTPLLIFPTGTFNDVSELLTYLQSNPVPINYELATSTEISFTTASLVTENAEIPLSNEDGVLIGKCTEQLSAEPGFHDAKIKLANDDGECYSNKIQLHVERSPQ